MIHNRIERSLICQYHDDGFTNAPGAKIPGDSALMLCLDASLKYSRNNCF